MVYDMEKGKFPVQLENIDSFVELGQVCSRCPPPLPSHLKLPPPAPLPLFCVLTAGATPSSLDSSSHSFLSGVGQNRSLIRGVASSSPLPPPRWP